MLIGLMQGLVQSRPTFSFLIDCWATPQPFKDSLKRAGTGRPLMKWLQKLKIINKNIESKVESFTETSGRDSLVSAATYTSAIKPQECLSWKVTAPRRSPCISEESPEATKL